MLIVNVCMSCACARARARARARVRVRVCVGVCVYECVCACVRVYVCITEHVLQKVMLYVMPTDWYTINCNNHTTVKCPVTCK